MHVEIGRDVLGRVLAIADGAVGQERVLPISAYILLDAKGDGIEVSATDLEVSLRLTAPGTVRTPGRVTAPAKKLTELVRAYTGTLIALSSDEKGHLTVADGKTKARLGTLPPEDFPDTWATPSMPTDTPVFPVAPVARVTLEIPDLARILDQTLYAVSEDTSRPHLMGCHLVAGGTVLTASATDGIRCARSKADAAILSDQGPLETLLPKRAASLLLDAMEGLDGPAALELSTERIRVTLPTLKLLATAISGSFPHLDSAIPTKGGGTVVVIDREVFLGALRRVSIVDKLLRLTIGDDAIAVAATSQDLGSAEETVTAKILGDPVSISFQRKLLTDALEAVETKEVELAFNVRRPVRIDPLGANWPR